MAASASPSGNGAQQQTAATQNAVMALFSRLKEVAAGMLAEVIKVPPIDITPTVTCACRNVIGAPPPPPPRRRAISRASRNPPRVVAHHGNSVLCAEEAMVGDGGPVGVQPARQLLRGVCFRFHRLAACGGGLPAGQQHTVADPGASFFRVQKPLGRLKRFARLECVRCSADGCGRRRLSYMLLFPHHNAGSSIVAGHNYLRRQCRDMIHSDASCSVEPPFMSECITRTDAELSFCVWAGNDAAEAEHAVLPGELPHHRSGGDGGVHGEAPSQRIRIGCIVPL